MWECGGEETVRETMEKHSKFTKSLFCPRVVCQSFVQGFAAWSEVGFCLAVGSVFGIGEQTLFSHLHSPDSLVQSTAEEVSGSVGFICLRGLNHSIFVHHAQPENHKG